MARLLPFFFFFFWDLWSGALASGCFSLLLVRISLLVHGDYVGQWGDLTRSAYGLKGVTSLMQLFLSFILFNCCEALIVFISPIP
jgi:hypothetical protein